MQYVNVGAWCPVGTPVASKKALRAALAAEDTRVMFYIAGGTAHLHPSQVTAGMTLTVTGPDPVRSRKWFAAVTRAANGRLVVK